MCVCVSARHSPGLASAALPGTGGTGGMAVGIGVMTGVGAASAAGASAFGAGGGGAAAALGAPAMNQRQLNHQLLHSELCINVITILLSK